MVEEVEAPSPVSGDGHVVVEEQIYSGAKNNETVVVGSCEADEEVLPHHHVLHFSCREGHHLLPRNPICGVAQFLSSAHSASEEVLPRQRDTDVVNAHVRPGVIHYSR